MHKQQFELLKIGWMNYLNIKLTSIIEPCFDTNNESKAILSWGTLWSNKTLIAINAAAPVAKISIFFWIIQKINRILPIVASRINT
jgi:hypothetical protein